MATRTFTSGGVDNLWSTVGNWDTVPVDDDTVVIPSGQTCEFDVDLSAWTNGINGMTVNGTFSLTRTAGNYYLKMKAATIISGSGVFDCGTSASPIPLGTNHTITGGTAWKFDGTNGLSFSIYDAEPAIKYVTLTAKANLGATVLSVDTDVTGDIWADGDQVRVVPVKYSIFGHDKVVTHTIAAGGITANTITLTSGLTISTMEIGSLVVLIQRNVKIIGTATNVDLFSNFQISKIVIGGGAIYGNTAGYNIRSIGTIISGGIWLQGAVSMFAHGMTISGFVLCGANGFHSANNTIVEDCLFAGVSTVFSGCYGSYVDNCKFRCVAFITITHGSISNCSIEGASNFLNGSYGAIIINCTVSNSYEVIYRSQVEVYDSAFYSGLSVSYSQGRFVNCLLSGTENSYYQKASVLNYTESIDHNKVPGAYKAWTIGGVTTKQTTVKPTGYDYSMQTVLENATKEGYFQKQVLVGAGASVEMTLFLRKNASMTYLPRIVIFNKSVTDPLAGGTAIHTFTMTNSIDTWESETYTYTNTTSEDITLGIRCQGKNATGNMYSLVNVDVINVDLTSALSKLDAIKAKTDVLKNPSLLIDGEIIV